MFCAARDLLDRDIVAAKAWIDIVGKVILFSES
jgi:hypothetical protein